MNGAMMNEAFYNPAATHRFVLEYLFYGDNQVVNCYVEFTDASVITGS